MTNRLHKSRTSRVLAGVCGGLGEYFAVDPTLVRLLFVLLTIFQGVGILAYIVLWIVMPEETTMDIPPREAMRENINKIKDDVGRFGDQFRGRPAGTAAGETVSAAETTVTPKGTEVTTEITRTTEAGDTAETVRATESYRTSEPLPPVDRATAANRQMLAGVALLILGSLFLLDNLNLFWWLNWGRMWPLVLVAIGAWLLYDRSRARPS